MSQYAIKKKAICRWAGVKVPKGRRSFCSDACVHEHKLRSDPGYLREQAFQRDTVWYEGVAEVSQRFPVRIAILFMGAGRIPEVGPAHLTFTAEEAVEAARAFSDAVIIPLHYEGWAHFSESRKEIEGAFANAGMKGRLRWMEPGCVTDLSN